MNISNQIQELKTPITGSDTDKLSGEKIGGVCYSQQTWELLCGPAGGGLNTKVGFSRKIQSTRGDEYTEYRYIILPSVETPPEERKNDRIILDDNLQIEMTWSVRVVRDMSVPVLSIGALSSSIALTQPFPSYSKEPWSIWQDLSVAIEMEAEEGDHSTV